MANNDPEEGRSEEGRMNTEITNIGGNSGELHIRGYSIEELAQKCAHEEVVYLLKNHRLPSKEELDDFKSSLKEERELSSSIKQSLHSAAERELPIVDAVRTAVSDLEYREQDRGHQQIKVISQFPTITAAYYRLRNGNEIVESHPDLDHAANYLYILSGEEPSDARSQAFETYLNTVVDHGLNASAYTARVIASTESDIISAVTGALGAFKGALHGGGPEVALDMLRGFDELYDIEASLRERFEEGTAGSYLNEDIAVDNRLIGFGHRVYQVRDPRAEVLRQAAEQLHPKRLMKLSPNCSLNMNPT